jgi:RNase P subunit RPR2
MKSKKLYFDIETSYNIVSAWNVGYKVNIPHQNIIKERAIICICYKWENERTVHSLTWDKDQCDKKMLQEFIKIANTADVIIGQNHEKFDLPWVRTRCFFHRIPMFPTYITTDTLKKARSGFRFNSNTLDYMGKYAGFGGKLSTDYSLWDKVILHKDVKALEYMVKYCKKDVLLLEQVYKELSPYITTKVHLGVLSGASKTSCPECSSENTVQSKIRMSATGIKKIQLQCKDCGKYHTVSETTIKNKEKEKKLPNFETKIAKVGPIKPAIKKAAKSLTKKK